MWRVHGESGVLDMGAEPFTNDRVWDVDAVLELWVHHDADRARLVLVGRLDAATAAHVTRVMTSLVSNGSGRVDIDLEGIDVVDTQGLGVLSEAARDAARCGIRVHLVRPSAVVERCIRGSDRATAPAMPVPA
jgi:anti-anti-sigma factor